MIIERWICKKCNKKWIYPIDKCLYCKGNIENQIGRKLKIIGITKVFIPSPMHPIVPYNILMLEDEHGNKIPKKTMNDYKIGEHYEEKKGISTNSVSISKVKYDIYESVKNTLDLIDVKINENSKILIIPNIEVASYEYQGITTNPKVLDSIIKYLLQNTNKDNITVGSQSYNNTEEAAGKTGILSVCRKHGINFIDFSEKEFVEKEIEGKKYSISKEVFNKDVIINLPVLKTSTSFIVSGALENIQRVVNIETQKDICNSDIEKSMIDINKLLPKYLTIADGTIGMQGNGPLIGEPSFLNIILASYDPIALDIVFSEIGMLDKPVYAKYFEGIVEVIGEEIEALKLQLKEPQKKFNIHYDIDIIDGKCCQLCYNAAIAVNQKLLGLRGEKCTIVIGNDFTSEDVKNCNRLIAFGDSPIAKFNELNIKPMIEIYGNPPDIIGGIIILKKVLSKRGEVKIGALDRVKASFAKNISKIKGEHNVKR